MRIQRNFEYRRGKNSSTDHQSNGEFEMIKGAGICRKLIDNWTACVPLILKYAIQTIDAVSKVFAMYGKDKITQFGNASTLSIEIIRYNLICSSLFHCYRDQSMHCFRNSSSAVTC